MSMRCGAIAWASRGERFGSRGSIVMAVPVLSRSTTGMMSPTIAPNTSPRSVPGGT